MLTYNYIVHTVSYQVLGREMGSQLEQALDPLVQQEKINSGGSK
jgi:hypothetical protein